ncbi:MAG: sigma-54 dependent transcriptional regulator [Thermoanaerobaculia bacterium]|nr:sigma-54 dependent transcriptional regulator [Thermoanaerobaculia bacterium]
MASLENPVVLLVEDDRHVRRPIKKYLTEEGFVVKEATTVTMGKAALLAEGPDAALLDYELPDGNALELLQEIQEKSPHVPAIIITGHGTIDLAVQAMKEGAEHFLTKPIELAALGSVLRRALENRRLQRVETASRRQTERLSEPDPFLGESRAIRRLAKEAELAVRASSPVLIQGETGSGKGVLARWIHDQGPRSREAFVDLNCAGLSRELLESELFGHAKGAFTGAVSDKQGLFEVAHRGTLFLDEIGDMDPGIQPKLLKALEEKRFRRLGETEERKVDVRLIAASNRSLEDLVAEGTFRPDLFYRINTFVLRIPALRERQEDIPAIAGAVVDRLCQEMGRPRPELTDEALEALKGAAWPGNIRELRNVLERALIRCGEESLGGKDLRGLSVSRSEVGAPSPAAGPGEIVPLEEMERRHIEHALVSLEGNVSEAADALDVPRSTLYQRLKAFSIDPSDYR